MASDVDDPTTVYAHLPSIFDSDPTRAMEPISTSQAPTASDHEGTYQSMFGSFLFADSEPLTRAVFVAPVETETTPEQLIDHGNDATLRPNHGSNDGSRAHTTPLVPPLAPVEDLSDEEDDFDGIPIRHASPMVKTKLNGDSDSMGNHSQENALLDDIVALMEKDFGLLGNAGDNDDGGDDESFLIGFTDEQPHDTIIAGSSLFKDIPDIDDLNDHDDDDDDGERIPFDHMDMLDESDSIRSSSPDSLLSSSQLQDDDIDDDATHPDTIDDADDDVTQWNDDFILKRPTTHSDRSNASLPASTLLNLHAHEQVDFIDTSRSQSPSSNASSHLSTGYNDSARIYVHDDELLTPSDSDDEDDDDDDQPDNDNGLVDDFDTFERDRSEEISLQINLVDHDSSRSRSSSASRRRSSPSSPDRSPIAAIDDDIPETKAIPTAPMALMDDDGDSSNHSGSFVGSARSNKASLAFDHVRRPAEAASDSTGSPHVSDDDDEFLSMMHDPSTFDDVSYGIDQYQVRNGFRLCHLSTLVLIEAAIV